MSTACPVQGQIPVLRASGSGSTTLSAFHRALRSVGLGYYNIIRISSVIPPDTRVGVGGKAPASKGAWGDRLYCVYADQRETTVGAQAWAGIGWVQRVDGQGGLFVEHEGDSEAIVERAIRASLADLVAGSEDRFSAPDWVLNGVTCTGAPVCALVVAPYLCAPWTTLR
jgi:arginine decarboxylase